MRLRILAASAALAVTVSLVDTAAAQMRGAKYGVVREKDLRIEMSDGIVLKADVLRPGNALGRPALGRFPVIVTQTPYNKNTSGCMCAPHLVQRGYVQVIVDVRGTGSSRGTWDGGLGARERRDGFEIVAWAASARRAWSNGSVGLRGVSYGAAIQFPTAAQRPPGLKAIFPIVPPGDVYRDFANHGGFANVSFIPGWQAAVHALSIVPSLEVTSDPVGAITTSLSHAAATVNSVASNADALTDGDLAYDGEYYRSRSPLTYVDAVDVPAFITSGWYDLFKRGSTMLYERLAQRGVPARLLMGPWTHNTPGAGLPTSAVPFSFDELELRWFDRWLGGIPDPTLDKLAPVTVYRLGSEDWHAEQEWPPAATRIEERYLTGPAGLGRPGGLSVTTPATSATSTLPAQPLSGLCSEDTLRWTPGTALGSNRTSIQRPQSLCESDHRVNDLTGLVFEAPLDEDLTIVGPIAARLFVSTNGRDGFLTVRVEDVAPDGAARPLSVGWQVLSMRALDEQRTVRTSGRIVRPFHPFTRESLLPVRDGEVNEVWVEIWPTAATLAAGHRLRLSIQPSDTPHLMGTTAQTVGSLGAVITLHQGPGRPSSLILPVQR